PFVGLGLRYGPRRQSGTGEQQDAEEERDGPAAARGAVGDDGQVVRAGVAVAAVQRAEGVQGRVEVRVVCRHADREGQDALAAVGQDEDGAAYVLGAGRVGVLEVDAQVGDVG